MNTHLPLARAVFGTHLNAAPDGREAAAEIDRLLNPGEVAFITGPSGAGKSTILREVSRLLRARRHAAISVDPERLPDRAVIDCLGVSFDKTLNLLAVCGLADGPILGLRPRELSTGQRWRLALAIALRKAQRVQRRGGHATILIDELGSTLDRISARCLCRTIRRFVMGRPLRAVCASHDESLMEVLGPRVLVVQRMLASPVIQRKGSPTSPERSDGPASAHLLTGPSLRSGLVTKPFWNHERR